MKTKFLIIVIAILTILIFTGCSKQKEKEQTIPQMSSDSVLDNKLFSDSVGHRNSELCLKIKDKNVQEECVSSINGLLLIDKAMQETDATICEKITLERYKEICETGVKEKLEKEKEEKQQSAKVQKALDAQDAEQCDTIRNEEVKYTCKYNIITNKALQDKDASLCDSIGFKDYIEKCKTGLAE